MIRDENVEAVRTVREALIQRYGGLKGWIEHLQGMDRDRAQAKRRKRAAESNVRSPATRRKA
jgi:hypothetical protein